MKTVLKITLGILLAGTILIVGCVALIGGAANEVQKKSDKTAISLQQYGGAKTGSATRAQLEARFGTPQSAQDIDAGEIKGIPASQLKSSCIYYNRKGEFASLFQFCFDGNGTLTSKASY